jgi:hypothetical protein
MDTHVKALGTANIIFGVGSFVVALLVLIIYGGPFGLYNSFMDYVLALLVVGWVLFHVLVGIPCIIGGIYLRQFAEWSRGLIIVTSALNILNLPLGSMLGCYGLWVLLTPETDPLFSVPPPDYRPKNVTHAAPANEEFKRVAGPHSPNAAQATIVPSPRS